MTRLSVWVGEDRKEWIENEAKRLDLGQAELIRELVDVARDHGTDSLLNQTESELNQSSDSELIQSNVFDRLDDLEAKIDALEGPAEPPIAQNRSDPSLSDSSTKTMNPLDQSEEIAGSGGVDHRDTHDTEDTRDEFLSSYRGFLEGRSPQKRHAKDATVAALRLLRENGTMATGELKDALYEEVGDQYGSKKAMWESISRYFDELPGFGDGGYGQWAYAGDEAVRDEIGEPTNS